MESDLAIYRQISAYVVTIAEWTTERLVSMRYRRVTINSQKNKPECMIDGRLIPMQQKMSVLWPGICIRNTPSQYLSTRAQEIRIS